jgi:hypothetical protein
VPPVGVKAIDPLQFPKQPALVIIALSTIAVGSAITKLESTVHPFASVIITL